MSLENKLIPNIANENFNDIGSGILSTEEMRIIHEIMRKYSVGECDVACVVSFLNIIGLSGKKFNFNLNTDIQRLLITNYPKKITFSNPSDMYEFSNNVNENTDVIVRHGYMSKGEEYERRKLIVTLSDLSLHLGDKKLVGTYGQLSFPTAEAEILAGKLIDKYLDQFDPDEYAILHSGSLLGVSRIGHEVGVEKEFDTVAIIPKTIEHLVDRTAFTCLLIEGEDWGDASFLFGGLPIDILFTGGGYWSYLEYVKAKQFGNTVKFGAFSGVRYAKEFDDGLEKELFLIQKA